jgi:hypothetical protein
MVTGYVYPEVERSLPQYPNKTPRAVFRNRGGGIFEELIEEAGPGAAPHLNEPLSPLRNDLSSKTNNWIKEKLEAVKSCPVPLEPEFSHITGIGPRRQAVLSQSQLFSRNDPRLHFGLGTCITVDIDVYWPSGLHVAFKQFSANQLITLKEGVGSVASRGWSKA